MPEYCFRVTLWLCEAMTQGQYRRYPRLVDTQYPKIAQINHPSSEHSSLGPSDHQRSFPNPI
jgi:hypothetical protein